MRYDLAIIIAEFIVLGIRTILIAKMLIEIAEPIVSTHP